MSAVHSPYREDVFSVLAGYWPNVVHHEQSDLHMKKSTLHPCHKVEEHTS